MPDIGVDALPLAGIRVVEFTHMVMGPTCGLLLADLGAEVIKVEPLEGDRTRRLLGSGAGFFPAFNRNKKSIAVDLKTSAGLEIAGRLARTADVVSENFKSGAMKALGLDYASLRKDNPRVIYVSHKGFLPGPYQDRTALDEVVQMMGGLAYMTGRPKDPIRAGASVNDIMGGMFGAFGVMAALRMRDRSGEGCEVQSALFENNVFLIAQHMMQFAVTGKPVDPMPSRISAWAVYDVFTVKGGEQIFLALVSDRQWQTFCAAMGLDGLLDDPRLATNNERVLARDWLMPTLRSHLSAWSATEIEAVFERNELPFARIEKPEALFDDVHLNESGGLASMRLPDGNQAKVPLLPLTIAGLRPGLRRDPPSVGQDTRDLMLEIGYAQSEIDRLAESGIVAE